MSAVDFSEHYQGMKECFIKSFKEEIRLVFMSKENEAYKNFWLGILEKMSLETYAEEKMKEMGITK